MSQNPQGGKANESGGVCRHLHRTALHPAPRETEAQPTNIPPCNPIQSPRLPHKFSVPKTNLDPEEGKLRQSQENIQNNSAKMFVPPEKSFSS